MLTVQDKVPARDRKSVVCRLLEHLEHAQLRYVIVGDSRAFPDEVESDIDIVIDTQQLQRFPALLLTFLAELQGSLVQVLQHEQTAYYFAFAWRDEAGELQILNPDVCSDYFRDGRLLLTAEELLAARVQVAARPDAKGSDAKGGFYTPAPAVACIYYLLKKVSKGKLTQRHGDYLQSEWAKDPAGVQVQLARFWPQQEADLLLQALSSGQWQHVSAQLPRLQQTLVLQSAPSRQSRWREGRRQLKRALAPTGLFVVLLGADGSGKSTVLEQVSKTLAPAFRQNKRYHLRPYFGARSSGATPTTEPHAQAPRSLLASVAKLALWWLDYNLSYVSILYPQLARSTLVIFDRYSDDLLVDAKRYRYGGPQRLTQWLNRFVPQPDLLVLLDAPVEVLYSRKQEVLYSEAARQREAYLERVKTLPYGHVVDASKPPHEVQAAVETLILEHLMKRTAKRLEREATL